MNIGMNDTIGTVVSRPISSWPQPHWNTAAKHPVGGADAEQVEQRRLDRRETQWKTRVNRSTESVTTAAMNHGSRVTGRTRRRSSLFGRRRGRWPRYRRGHRGRRRFVAVGRLRRSRPPVATWSGTRRCGDAGGYRCRSRRQRRSPVRGDSFRQRCDDRGSPSRRDRRRPPGPVDPGPNPSAISRRPPVRCATRHVPSSGNPSRRASTGALRARSSTVTPIA